MAERNPNLSSPTTQLNPEKFAEVVLFLGLLKESTDEIKADVKEIKEGQLREFEKHMVRTDGRMDRLEWLVYGACSLAATETVGCVIALVVWLIQRNVK